MMRRLLLIIGLCLVTLSSNTDAQDKFRARFASVAVGEAPAPEGPVVTVQTPSASGSYTTSAASVSPTGTCIGQSAACVSVAWVNDRGGSGSATGAATWSIAGGGSSTAAQDSFTGDGSNVDVVTHTPNIGSAWSQCINTEAGANYFRLFNGGGYIHPVNTVSSHTLGVCMSPTLSGNDYDVGFTVKGFGGGIDELIVGFGRNSGTGNSCGLVIRYGELQLYSVISGTPAAIGAAVSVSSANGDVYLVEKRGDDHTIKQNGITRATRNTANCSAGSQLFIAAGAYDGSGRITNMQADDWIVTDQAASGAIPLLSGVNVITFTGTDAAANTGPDHVFTVTRTAGDTNDPQISITDPEPDGAYDTTLSTVDVEGTAQDDVALAGAPTWTCATCTPASGTATGTTTWTIAGIGLAVGANTIIVTAVDTSANDATAQIIVTRTTDATVPTISIVTPSASTPYTAVTGSGTIGGSAADNLALQSVTWACDIASPVSGTATGLQNWLTATLTWGAGDNTCTVTATDQAGNTATDTIVVQWAPPLTISTTTMPAATQNVAYSVQLVRVGGTSPFTWVEHVSGDTTIPGGGACTGLTISSAGVVAGTPTTTGTCNFTARVTDNVAATDTQALAVVVSAPGTGRNDQYTTWTSRGDLWKCLSLRPLAGQGVGTCRFEHQLKGNAAGGYRDDSGSATANTNNEPYIKYFPYSGGTDTDDHAQDGTKFIIPAFSPAFVISWTLTQNVTAASYQVGCNNTITIAIPASTSIGNLNVSLKINNEVVETCDPDGGGPIPTFNTSTGVVYVTRALYGTTAADHTAPVTILRAISSIHTHITYPNGNGGGSLLGTAEGNTYLYVWDGYWTDSYYRASPNAGQGGTLENHKYIKVFDVNAHWLEPNTVFNNSGTGASCFAGTPNVFASYGTRTYLNKPNDNAVWAASSGTHVGPNTVLVGDQLAPRSGEFCLHANRWTRFWVRHQQVPNDWDILDIWVADEVQDPVQIITGLQVSIHPTELTLTSFQWSFNASKDSLRHSSQEDLVSYQSNWAAFVSAGVASAGTLSDAAMASDFLFKPLP